MLGPRQRHHRTLRSVLNLQHPGISDKRRRKHSRSFAAMNTRRTSERNVYPMLTHVTRDVADGTCSSQYESYVPIWNYTVARLDATKDS
jgi:hypothetical protein